MPHMTVSSDCSLRLAFGGLFALAAGMGIGRFIHTPILPPMIEALGLSAATAGLIASANFGGYLVGALVAAFCALPGSRRMWLVGSLAVSGLTTAGMALTEAVPFFLLLRFAGGLCSALVLIFASSLVLEQLAIAGRSQLASLHFAGIGVGIAASALVVAGLQALGQNWPSLWLGGGALALAGTLAVFFLTPGGSVSPRTRPPVGSPDLQSIAQTGRRLRRLILAYGLFGFGYVITATFIVAIVRASPSIRPLEPAIWLVVGLSAAPSIMLWSWLARRIGIVDAFAIACVAEAIGVLASIASPTEAGILLAATLLGGTFVGITALGLMRAQELAFGDPRRVIAQLTGAFGFGQIVGPLFAGAVFDLTGDFALTSCVAAGGLLIAAVLVRR